MPIGVAVTPIQSYDILNDSSQYVEYKVDVNALKQVYFALQFM